MVRQKTSPNGRKEISAEEFVKVWQESATCKEAAERLGKSRIYASSTATRLRTMGINLKTMPRGNGGNVAHPIDVDRLNSVIDDMAGAAKKRRA